MSGSKFPDEQNHYRGHSRYFWRFSISAVLVFLAVIVGIFAYFLLFSGRQRIVSDQGQIVSAIDSRDLTEEQGQQISESQQQNKALDDQITLVNSIDELDDTVMEATPNPVPPKPVRGSTHSRVRWTATPLPTNTPVATPSPIPTFVGELTSAEFKFPSGIEAGEKWIDVNLTSQTLVAYEGIRPVYQSLVSTGTNRYPTVTGQFRIWLRFASQDMNGYRLGYDYFLQDVPYVQYFFEDYALHGTFWHNNFGTPMSHGCVNLPTPAAEWLFHWASNGTLVNVHS
jgi:lipoprotein-anchoring transpeptidase ErfK/SrfK